MGSSNRGRKRYSIPTFREFFRCHIKKVIAILAIVVAGIHVLHPSLGGPALLVYINHGTLVDPRPLAFVLIGFLLVFGVMLGYQGFEGKWLYLGGIVLTSAIIVGYPAWHTILEHGAFWPHLEPHYHPGNPVRTVIQHLIDDPIALLSKLVELFLLGLLVALFRISRR